MTDAIIAKLNLPISDTAKAAAGWCYSHCEAFEDYHHSVGRSDILWDTSKTAWAVSSFFGLG